MRLSGLNQEKKAHQVVEYTKVATITGKTEEYGRVQQKRNIQAAFAHKQGVNAKFRKSERRDISTFLGQC